VNKLQIRVLPTVILFVDGVAKDRIVGFQELGGKDEFETIILEERISKSGCIPKPPKVSTSVQSIPQHKAMDKDHFFHINQVKKNIVFGGIRSRDDDDDDLDF